MELNSKILVTGCDGMAGSAVIRELTKQGYTNITAVDRRECDLMNTINVNNLFVREKPEYVFHIAAKVGGIYANDTQSGAFTYENLMMECNVIESARLFKVKKLLFCGSACIYPKFATNPITEGSLLTGQLEETNKGYAVAKIAGVILCQMYRKQYGCNFISAMPTNLYGPGDNFHPTDSHVMPALILKLQIGKEGSMRKDGKWICPEVEIWGSGIPRREFLYVDDLANALVFLMNSYNDAEPINVGTGIDISIKELVQIIKYYVMFEGEIVWNTAYPDGVMERRLDVSKINSMGWFAKVSLHEGVEKTCNWFMNQRNNGNNVRYE